MVDKRTKREERRSAARRRAEQHASGYETSLLKVPEGVSFWEVKKGVHYIDIIPYVVKGGNNPYADDGESYYERTFWQYNKIGPEEKRYVAPGKTFGKPDFIQDYRAKEAKNPNADSDYLKSLNPRERQLFLVFDHEDKDKGIQLWESSYHTFGKLLDNRIKNSREEEGWDFFYLPGTDGMTLRLTITEESGGTFNFNEVTAIDFIPRKEALSDELIKHGICLDELPVEMSYDELKEKFLGTDSTDAGSDEKSDDTKEEPEKEPEKSSTITAEDLNLSKADEVGYKGQTCTIAKISEDGTKVTLLDANDDVVSGVPVSDLSKLGPKDEKKDEQKTEPSKEEEKPTESFDGADFNDGDSEPPKEGDGGGEDPWDEDWG